MFKNIGVAFKFLFAISIAIFVLQVVSTTIAYRSSHDTAAVITDLAVEEFEQQKVHNSKLLHDSVISRGESLAALLSDIANAMILSNDFQTLNLMANNAAMDPDIDFVEFFGPENRLLTTKAERNDRQEIIHTDIIFDGMKTGSMELGLNLDAQVKSDTSIQHRIDGVVSQTQNFADAATNAVLMKMIAVSLLSILSLCGLTYFILRRVIIKPFYKLGIQMGINGSSLSKTSTQVSDASEMLASGTSAQAASLDKTTISLQEITDLIRDTAQHTQEVTKQAGDARNAAQAGSESMQRMSDAINLIKDSSDQTAAILKSIDEIAFQTNLLALNAAVEAARAGDAGKGFAVVAEEVRSLSLRSAEAARDTARLINESQTNADNGVEMADEMNQNLVAIVGNVTEVSNVIEEINQASERQTNGIEQIGNAIADIDNATQNNASGAQQTASASKELESLADDVESLVDVMLGVMRGKVRPRTKSRDRQDNHMPVS